MARWGTKVGTINVGVGNVGDDPYVTLTETEKVAYIEFPDDGWPEMSVSMGWTQLLEIVTKVVESGMISGDLQMAAGLRWLAIDLNQLADELEKEE